MRYAVCPDFLGNMGGSHLKAMHYEMFDCSSQALWQESTAFLRDLRMTFSVSVKYISDTVSLTHTNPRVAHLKTKDVINSQIFQTCDWF